MFHVTDHDFEREVLGAEVPALVDFWAPWCAPCHIIAPAVEEIAKTFSGSIKVAKVNVDESPMTAGSFGIMSIPTLMLFKDGKVVDRIVGVVPEAQLLELVQKVL